jgi:hypothetical protein
MATAQQPLNPEVHHLTRKPIEAEQLATITPIVLLQQAIAQGVSIEQLERLQAMYERHEAREAKKAYDAAMKEFKAASPRITKNHRVYFEAKDRAKGTTDYRHATLDNVCDAVIGGLSRVGISHRWKVAQANEWITVTCVLTHEAGHAEETSLRGCPDTTGNKNSIQAVGSTVTYLQRYTLLAATGLATSEQDNDGRGAATIEAEGLTDERIEQLGRQIANAANENELKTAYFPAVREARAAKDRTAEQLFMRTKDARKRELQ